MNRQMATPTTGDSSQSSEVNSGALGERTSKKERVVFHGGGDGKALVVVRSAWSGVKAIQYNE